MLAHVGRTEKIQKALASVYLKLYDEIKKDENYPVRTVFLRQKYNRKVYDASRQAISQVFAEGQRYVGRVLGVETYSSDRDIRQIKEETDKAVGIFWTRLDRDAGREREIDQANQRLVVTEKKDKYDTAFYMANAAMIATTGALALSTISKTNQVVADPELPTPTKTPKIKWVARQDEKTCHRLPNGGEGCAELDGQEWEVDDPDIPVPGQLGPNGTHPNCRCYLELE